VGCDVVGESLHRATGRDPPYLQWVDAASDWLGHEGVESHPISEAGRVAREPRGVSD
jgi:hypothetical protein